MGAFGPFETMDMLAGLSPSEQRARREREVHARPSQASAPPRRWWFAFDGWRTAELQSEYVLA